MKKKYAITTLLALSLVSLITLTSNSNGPGGNRTGAPGSSGNCGACHGASTDATAQISVEILDNGTAVSTYVPGKTYDLELKASGNSTKMGFQLSAINGSNSAAGSITNPPSGTQVYTAGSQQIWGHTTGGSGTWKSKWTAPEAATGTVRMFACLVLSNSNGNNGGDFVHAVNIAIEEESSNQIETKSIVTNRFQNPVTDHLVFQNPIQSGWIWNQQGQLVRKLSNGIRYNLSDLNSGSYLLQYQLPNGKRHSEILIKE